MLTLSNDLSNMKTLDIDLIVGLIAIISAICGIVFYIGSLKSQIDKNSWDINASRKVIRVVGK